MAISKIILNGVTQMDVTGDTVAGSNLLSGYQATKNDGTKVTGTFNTVTGTFTIDAGAVATYNSSTKAIVFS